MDLRLEELPFEFEGRTYKLRCNMNVLADVQEMNGGFISTALEGKRAQKTVLQFLAAMMNDYADEQGWFIPDATGEAVLAKEFTPRGLGRVLRFGEVPVDKIMGLIVRSLTPPKTAEEKEQPEETAGN
jgi:hypothetical protein